MKIISFIFVFQFFSCCCFAQRQLDFGEIPRAVDSSFLGFFQRQYTVSGLIPLTESKNQLEIRYYAFGMFGGHCSILSFDGYRWHFVHSELSYDTSKTTRFDTIDIAQPILEDSFDSLKVNKLFYLEGQRMLNIEQLVWDGAQGFVSYKAGNAFGTYDFDNPCDYANLRKNIAELKYYCNVESTFNKLNAFGQKDIIKKKRRRFLFF
jgi:hypothetical protein